MDTFVSPLPPAGLIAVAVAAVLAILVLVSVFKLHAFITLIVVSAATALAAGIPLDQVVPTMTEGFGTTLASVALLVALGAMLGRLVEYSGGAAALAEAMVARFGEERAAFALGVASLIMGFPIFFDAGLVVMLPVIFAVARRLGGPVIAYGIPAAGAFSVMHVFVPPHPGPIAASEFFGAQVGVVLLVGLIVALPCWYLTGYLLGQRLAKRFDQKVVLLGEMRADAPTKPASAGTVIAVLALPMLLIFGNTGVHMAASVGLVDEHAAWVRALVFVGSTPIALTVTALVALVVLGWRGGAGAGELEKLMDSALGPICSVVLITGAGGMFGGVLRASGIGDTLTKLLADLGLPVIAAAFVVAGALRIAQGSATVALTTSAALMAPAVAGQGFNEFQLAAIVVATAAGSVMASHVNDSGFWLVGRLMGLDTATTLRTWTVNQTLIALVGFAGALAVYWVAGI